MSGHDRPEQAVTFKRNGWSRWRGIRTSRAERVEQAKEDWKAGRFPVVPGDEKEFIPFPG